LGAAVWAIWPFERQGHLVGTVTGSPSGRPSQGSGLPILTDPPDELAFHSITSSARPTSGSGTLRPSALAVFRLMINSTLVVCWTGRSPGFSPLRILPT